MVRNHDRPATLPWLCWYCAKALPRHWTTVAQFRVHTGCATAAQRWVERKKLKVVA